MSPETTQAARMARAESAARAPMIMISFIFRSPLQHPVEAVSHFLAELDELRLFRFREQVEQREDMVEGLVLFFVRHGLGPQIRIACSSVMPGSFPT